MSEHENSAPGLHIDPNLTSSSCMGIGLHFRHIWELAERYVRHGDEFHRQAGMKLIAEFADRVPLDDAASLIEQYFDATNYVPPVPCKGSLDYWAVRAAVAVGLATDHFKPGDARIRRQRMAAIMARSLLVVAREPGDRRVIERAIRALDRGNETMLESNIGGISGWTRGHRFDQEIIERCGPLVEDHQLDEAVRVAMIMLENRLRASTGATLDRVGVDLALDAFRPGAPLNFGQTPAEQEGLLNLFRSAFLMFRNPTAHRFTEHGEDRAFHVLMQIDLLLDLIAEANTKLYRPTDHLAPDEVGQDVRVERALQADLDGDGENERVLVFSQQVDGPIGAVSTGGRLYRWLVLKEGAGSWRRQPMRFSIQTRPPYLRRDDWTLHATRLDDVSAIDFSGDGTKRVVFRGSQGPLSGIIQVLGWRHGSAELVSFRGKDHFGEEKCVVFNTEQGSPVFKDADGDGILELYVPRTQQFGAPPELDRSVEVIRYVDVYAFDAAQLLFQLAARRPAPGQNASGQDSRDFLRELDAPRHH